MKRNERGFTLMELMVVIVIVAILAAVAVPLYVNYVRDAQRTEAKGAIGAIISAEQVNLQKTGGYLTATPTNFQTALNVDLTDTQANWTFTLAPNGAANNGFIVTATGITGRPSAGLSVTYTHTRSTGGVWSDDATPSGGTGGGGTGGGGTGTGG